MKGEDTHEEEGGRGEGGGVVLLYTYAREQREASKSPEDRILMLGGHRAKQPCGSTGGYVNPTDRSPWRRQFGSTTLDRHVPAGLLSGEKTSGFHFERAPVQRVARVVLRRASAAKQVSGLHGAGSSLALDVRGALGFPCPSNAAPGIIPIADLLPLRPRGWSG